MPEVLLMNDSRLSVALRLIDGEMRSLDPAVK